MSVKKLFSEINILTKRIDKKSCSIINLNISTDLEAFLRTITASIKALPKVHHRGDFAGMKIRFIFMHAESVLQFSAF